MPEGASGTAAEKAEVFGLLALMEIQASRLPASTGPDGALLPLTEQNRACWDQPLIRGDLDSAGPRRTARVRRRERRLLRVASSPYSKRCAHTSCTIGYMRAYMMSCG